MIGPDLEQLAEELSAYLDGELSPEQRQLVEAKLSASAQARQLLGDLRATSQLVNSLPRHAAPPAVVADLNAQLERSELLAGFDEAETAVVTDRPGRFPRLSMAAMVAIVAIGGWWMMTGPAASPTMPFQDQFALADKSTPARAVEESGNPVSRARKKSSYTGGATGKAKSLDSADVETKLAAGIAPQALRGHAFANEPIRLVIPVRYQSEQAALLLRLARRLASTNAIDLATTDSGANSSTGAFYYRGRSGVNYEKGAPRQILIRATRPQVDKVLQELRSLRNASSVSLKAGALTLRGSRKAREALTMLVSPDGDDRIDGNNPTETQKDLLDDILASLGVDPETFLQPTDDSGPNNKPTLALAGADETKQESAGDPAAPRGKSASTRHYRRAASAPANATRQSGSRELGVANTEMSATTGATQEKQTQPTEVYVTFVIELPVAQRPPASRPPTNPTRGDARSK